MDAGEPLHLLAIWNLPEPVEQQMRALAPQLVVHRARRGEDGYEPALAQAHIILGWPGPQDIARAANARWIQIGSAGADRLIPALPAQVVLTNASGVFGVPIAEHIFAMMLALVRGVHVAVRSASAAQWKQDFKAGELFGATCGIVGLGDIGVQTALRAKAFGMRVLAMKRTAANRPQCVDELCDVGGLDHLLAASDHVVVTLPGTIHTRHMIDARRLGLMKSGSHIYNVGRGITIDQQALIAALENGHLAGAGLDVFDPEPLPADNPLWRMPNVIVSPHRSGATPRHAQRLSHIVLANFQRFLAGRPLENQVDRQWGY